MTKRRCPEEGCLSGCFPSLSSASQGRWDDCRWSHRYLSVARRTAQVLTRLAPVLARAVCGATEAAVASSLHCRLETLGPVFARLSQALAESHDECHQWSPAAVPCVDETVIHRVIEEDLGKADLFEVPPNREMPVSISPLGQVYRWRLDGLEVAVKVQREDLRRTVSLDLFVLLKIIAFVPGADKMLVPRPMPAKDVHVSRFGRGVFPIRDDHEGHEPNASLNPDFVAWASQLWAELDYEREARDQDTFCNRILEQIPDVAIPRVRWDATSGRVLTTEWVEGVHLADARVTAAAAVAPSLVAGGLVSASSSCSAAQILSLALQVSAMSPRSEVTSQASGDTPRSLTKSPRRQTPVLG